MLLTLHTFKKLLLEKETEWQALELANNMIQNQPDLPDGYIARSLYHARIDLYVSEYWQNLAMQHHLMQDEQLVVFTLTTIIEINSLAVHHFSLIDDAATAFPTNPTIITIEAKSLAYKAGLSHYKYKFKEARSFITEAYSRNPQDSFVKSIMNNTYSTTNLFFALYQLFFIFLTKIRIGIFKKILLPSYINFRFIHVLNALTTIGFILYLLFHWFGWKAFLVIGGFVALLFFMNALSNRKIQRNNIPIMALDLPTSPEEVTSEQPQKKEVPSWDYKK